MRALHPAPFVFAVLLLSFAGPVAAQTVTVTTTEDVVDFAAPQTAAQLPGPDGEVSFREALMVANAMAGPQTIAFAIDQAEWWLVTNMAILKQEVGIFPLEDDGTIVDFSTQTAFTGNTNPNGGEVGIYGLEPNAWGVASIYILGDDCVIRGLGNVWQRGYAVEVWGSDNRIVGCTIDGPLHAAIYLTGPFGGAPSTGNIVGGTAPGEGNVLTAGNDGVRIDAPSNGNVVIGNVLSGSWNGVSIRGSQFTGTANDNRIGGPTAAERNIISNAGHYGEEGFPVGAQVSIEWAVGTIVEGNFIGTTPNGLASAGQIGPAGVEVEPNASNTIIRDNLIGGIVVVGVNHYQGQVFGDGIRLEGQGNGTVIQGNLIGTDVTGEAPIPNRYGIREAPLFLGPVSTDTTIGGTAPGQGNVVAFNDLQGILLTSAITGVTISGNSIFANGQLGIDLAPLGATQNDPLDPDGGTNLRQNFPVLQGVSASGQGTIVGGTLNSLPNQAFVLEFFGSPQADPSGFGEGRHFLGSEVVVTDGAGNAAFSADVLPLGADSFVTATATHVATGNTSEFSIWVQAGAWSDLGSAKPGSTGTPHLEAVGPLAPGTINQIVLTNAAPSSTAVLVAGLTFLGAPFKGGTLVPDPDLLLVLPTNLAGAVTLPFTWPAGVPAGTSLFLQFWITDPAASFGLSASNGLQGTST